MRFPVLIGRHVLPLIRKVIIVSCLCIALTSFGCDSGSAPNANNGNTRRTTPVPVNTNATPVTVNSNTKGIPNSNTKATPPPANSNINANSAPDAGFDIDREMQGMKEGAITTQVPEEMSVGETRSVYLVLAPDAGSAPEIEANLKRDLGAKSSKRSKEKIETTTKIETAKAKFSRFMQAKLSGEGFEITPITPEHQPVANNENTQWQWQVKAVESGEKNLYLSANAIFVVEGTERVRAINTFSKVIQVAAIKVPVTDKILTFISNYWQWIIGTIIIPLGALLIGKFTKKSKSKTKSKKDA